MPGLPIQSPFATSYQCGVNLIMAQGILAQDAEITEKALFALLALCNKNLSLYTMAFGRHDNFILT